MKDSFLHIVTDDLIRRVGGLNGLENCTMVFPMQRAGLFVKQDLTSRLQPATCNSPTGLQPATCNSLTDLQPATCNSPTGLQPATCNLQPVILPHFTTIDALADSLCPLRADEEIESVCTLYEFYKRHTKHTLPIDAFYGWGLQLLNDFSAVDMALLDVEKMMQFTADAAQLDECVLDQETRERLTKLLHDTGSNGSVQEYFHDLWQALPDIYKAMHNAHEQAGVGTRGARTRWVIEHFEDEDIQERIAGRTFVFVGFNYLLAAERRLMELIQAHTTALFYWDYDPSFTLDDSVYKFIRSNIAQFGNCLPDEPSSFSEAVYTPSAKRSIQAIACQSSSAQSQYVHDWLLTHHHEGDKTAIVLADESMLQSVVYALPSQEQLSAPINITKGYGLKSTRLFVDCMALLDTQREQGRTVIELLPAVMEALQQQYINGTHPEEQTWQAVLLHEAYYQTQRVLRQMQQLLTTHPSLLTYITDPLMLRNLVCRALEMVTIPFHGEPITDIQIIGVLETRLLDFDHVLILNVEEDIVPAKSNDRSFLPFDLRRECRMATREEDTRIYAYNFFRLFRRAKDVTMTFCDSFTDKGKRSMSRFLMQMLCAPDWQVERTRLQESAWVQAFEMTPTVFRAEDTMPDHLSPSAISEYLTCPRWFYLHRILGIEEPQTEEVMLPQDVIGTFLHAVLQRAYSDAQPDLSKALDEAYAEQKKTHYVRSEHEAENHAILAMARQVLHKDQSVPFQLVWLEHPINVPIGGIRLTGVIDRMDIIERNGQSSLRILDYKSGGYQEKKVNLADLADLTEPTKLSDTRYILQTLIYCEMVARDRDQNGCPSMGKPTEGALPIIAELLFPRQIDADGQIRYQDEPIADYVQTMQASFAPKLEEIIQTICRNAQVGQEFVMQPNLTVCAKSFCPFHLLCNREEKK